MYHFLFTLTENKRESTSCSDIVSSLTKGTLNSILHLLLHGCYLGMNMETLGQFAKTTLSLKKREKKKKRGRRRKKLVILSFLFGAALAKTLRNLAYRMRIQLLCILSYL